MNPRPFCRNMAQALLLAIPLVAADAWAKDPYALEPSINGGVSATGMFASQDAEDRYLQQRPVLELEPCIDGGVSATGLYVSQAAEDRALQAMQRVAGN